MARHGPKRFLCRIREAAVQASDMTHLNLSWPHGGVSWHAERKGLSPMSLSKRQNRCATRAMAGASWTQSRLHT
eukprot:7360112-Prorocentrum_lima.AAC.1